MSHPNLVSFRSGSCDACIPILEREVVHDTIHKIWERITDNGPVVSVTTFKDEAEALAIANDTEYGLGAGVWTRDMNRAQRMGRGIQAGRVWINCYHAYPAHAAFGGYKKSGIGRETHKMMLNHYQNTKNLLVSYDITPLGFF